MEIKNIDQLPEDVQKRFVPFLQKMVQTHGEKIQSVYIYGSATGKNYIPKVSDINSLFLFSEVDFPVLEESLKIISSGIEKKIAAPLFLTKEHIESSLDVFPIEFLDIKENHVCLYGEGALSSLDINGEHIRLFCEQQIKGKLVRIRQAYLEIGLRKKGVEALLKESLAALIPIFRNLIRLKGQSVPADKGEIIKQLCALFFLDEKTILPIYLDTSNDEKIDNKDVRVFLSKYISEIDKLAQAVDQL